MRAPAAVACLSDVLAIVLDRLADIQRRQQQHEETLDAIVRALDRGRGARDAADVALLLAIDGAIGDRPFTSRQLLAHARQIAPALLDAIEACDVTTAGDLGSVCRRLEQSPRADVWMERIKPTRRGILRRVRVSASHPRTA